MNIEGVSIVLNAMLEVCVFPWLDESGRLLQITIHVPTLIGSGSSKISVAYQFGFTINFNFLT